MPSPYCYDYPRPAVTVDLVAFTRQAEGFRVLMIRRKRDPFQGRWALPGGFVEIDEPIEAAARRELKEETGLDLVDGLHFLGVWGEPGRDPRGRVISMVYSVAIALPTSTVVGGDDAEEAAWLDPFHLANLAFDHEAILRSAVRWLVDTLTTRPDGLGFLPRSFDRADVDRLFRHLKVPAHERDQAVERFLRDHAEPIGRYRARTNAIPVKGKGRPRKGSRNPSREA